MIMKAYNLDDNQRAVIHVLISKELARQKEFMPWLSQLADTFAKEHKEEVPPRPEGFRLGIIPVYFPSREAIVSSVMDESIKDRTHTAPENTPLVEVIGYVFPGDKEELGQMLDRFRYGVNGEFLRLHSNPDNGYDTMLDFSKRMGLIDDQENELTALGIDFLKLWS